MKTWTGTEGRVRLSEDDGPASTQFLEDDYDDDNEGLELTNDREDEPLTERIRQAEAASETPPLEPLHPDVWKRVYSGFFLLLGC